MLIGLDKTGELVSHLILMRIVKFLFVYIKLFILISDMIKRFIEYWVYNFSRKIHKNSFLSNLGFCYALFLSHVFESTGVQPVNWKGILTSEYLLNSYENDQFSQIAANVIITLFVSVHAFQCHYQKVIKSVLCILNLFFDHYVFIWAENVL